MSKCEGIIVNRQGWLGKHWFTIRKVDGTYFNLDSKLSEPQLLPTEQAARSFIKECLSASSAHVLLVLKEDLKPADIYTRGSSKQTST